ncbi:MAG TPA: signal peptide peptidase SppA [Phnomibacter sp.]|nr:signal peptide peptidase SppA [Phnomibacter sp.]
MRSFFKIFFASLLALTIFTIIMFVLGIGLFSTVAEEDKPEVKSKTVLVLDISKPMMEQRVEAGLPIPGMQEEEMQGLFEVTRALDAAASDTAVKGIYLVGTYNPNGFATATELRQALLRFKAKGKFILAFANYFDQRSYEIANTANEIYLNPAGMLDWQGYSVQLAFFKNALDKLEIKPEIFFAGQFKSATEPYRFNKMSEPNRLQMQTFIESLYGLFLSNTASSRKLDTAVLRKMATELSMCTAEDALKAGLVDKLLYDDEVKTILAKKVGAASIEKINFMKLPEYIKAGKQETKISSNKIAVIYAQGEIVDGKGDEKSIGGDTYRQLLRKARFDKDVKAVVFRVNSPGGSAIASEVILRELLLLKKEKPVIVSMGDYGASGGYYISCGADSIFAQPNTLTGSIGVFTMLFDASKAMSNKLGITFDEVSTTPSATLGSPFRPITATERMYLQRGIDSIYARFKGKVADGRKLSVEYVDSIGQGRIWSGKDAVANKLVDRLGSTQDAVASAAKMAGIKEYSIKEWPEVEPFWQKLFGDKSKPEAQAAFQIKQYMGTEFYTAWKQLQDMKAMAGKAQTRLPFFIMSSGQRP